MKPNDPFALSANADDTIRRPLAGEVVPPAPHGPAPGPAFPPAPAPGFHPGPGFGPAPGFTPAPGFGPAGPAAGFGPAPGFGPAAGFGQPYPNGQAYGGRDFGGRGFESDHFGNDRFAERSPFEGLGGGRGGFADDQFGGDFGPRPFDARGGRGFNEGMSGNDMPLPQRIDPAVDKAFDIAALNPLVAAASPLLWLAGRLNESSPPDDVGALRERTLAEIRRFETAAMARGVAARTVRVARYALAATIDDIVLNTAWAGQTSWPTRGLVSSLYNETWGGERFYELLSQLLMNPDDNVDALELMAICLSIGFAGKYRVMEGGQGQLNRLRHDLYRTIRRVRGPYERGLSTAWATVAVPHKPPSTMANVWIAAGVVALIVAALWIAASLALRGKVEAAAEKLRGLAPALPVAVEKAPLPALPQAKRSIGQTQIQRISAALADDIAAGRVEVADTGQTVTIRLLAASFPSGGSVLALTEAPLVDRIGKALDREPGPILVIGHTDNVKVSAGSRLGDNQVISAARARSAADMLRKSVSDPTRISSEGRGDSSPIASNDTQEGRARNRRVEFQIPAEATL